MQESPFIEYLMQKYSEQGARETSIKNTLSVLTERFPTERCATRIAGT